MLRWDAQSVSLSFSLNSNEMRTANLHILLWSNNKLSENKATDKLFLVGECYHFISKIVHKAQ